MSKCIKIFFYNKMLQLKSDFSEQNNDVIKIIFNVIFIQNIFYI